MTAGEAKSLKAFIDAMTDQPRPQPVPKPEAKPTTPVAVPLKTAVAVSKTHTNPKPPATPPKK